MAIKLKLELADGSEIDGEELTDKVKNFDALSLILNQKVVMNPNTQQWTETDLTFQEAEQKIEEIDGEGGGYLPTDEWGGLLRDYDDSAELEALDEDFDYYYRVASVEWEGESGFEEYTANWMNEHNEHLKDLVYHGCQSGIMGDLVYHSQVIDCIKEYKRDIEIVVQEIHDNIGELGFLFGEGQHHNARDFSFDRLVWMCFEETVRNALDAFQLDDI